MSRVRVTITGGSGFVGQLLRRGLRDRDYRVDVFDRLRGPLVNALRREWLGANAPPDAIRGRPAAADAPSANGEDTAAVRNPAPYWR